MRQLFINGQLADVERDTVIELKLRSSIFVFDKLLGSYSLSFDLPYKYSARNQMIFNFGGNSRRSNKSSIDLPAQLYFKGMLLADGKISATKYGDSVSCYLLIDNGAFLDQSKDKLITELDWGTFQDDFLVKKRYFPNYDYTLPFFSLDAKNFNCSKYSETTYKIGQDNTTGVTLYCHICPSFYISFLIKRLFEIFDYKVGSIETIDADDIVMLGLTDLVKHFWAKNPGAPATRENLAAEAYEINQHLPEMTIREFILSVENFFNIKFLVRNNVVSVVSRENLIKSQASKTFYTDKLELTPISESSYKYKYNVEINGEFPWVDLSEDSRQRVLVNSYITKDVDRNEPLDNYLYQDLSGNWFEKEYVNDDTIRYKWVSFGEYQAYGTGENIISTDLFGAHIGEVEFNNLKVKDETFKAARLGFIVDHETTNQRLEDSDGTNFIGSPATADDGISLFEKFWRKTFDWLNNEAEDVEGYVAERSKEWFLLNLDFSQKYRDQDEQNYLLEEVVVGIGHEKLTGVRFKGKTCL